MPAHWQNSAISEHKSANRGDFDELVERLASRQRRLVRSDQLLAAGFARRTIASRIERRRLFTVHAGVYTTHPPPYSPHQRYLAATYACGEGSLISGFCSAWIFSLVETPPLTAEVTNETGRGRSRQGITVRRTHIDPRDRAFRHGIPTTSVARTVIDCAHRAGPEGTEDLIMAADSLGILKRARLEELADEHRARPGIGHVLRIISDDPVELRSKNERRMFSICREFGIPLPLCNHRIDVSPNRHFYADFLWPQLNLIVEADSWRWHGGRQANEDDTDRDQLLAIAGFHVVHFTRDQILKQRAETGRRLVALTSPNA